MGLWFQKHKPPPRPSQAQQPSSPTAPNPSVQQLELRLQLLEEHIASLTAKRPEIRIDTLHIHQPVLENLTFRLDQLDIKELSGSLNLGNNFGAQPNSKSPQVDEAMNKSSATTQKTPASVHTGKATTDMAKDIKRRESFSQETSGTPSPGTERTSTGYRYTPQSKSTGGV
ncbi:hypothetical protein GK047_14335 [Paenibacillus sp. SYP-B3998]|uniref:Uncharacterized protein n=1 Tax=Paenibacillus sp. SYP-B3998 TaxID=2678564 RepID=A0A6G3ZY92_9BACL|nr:hypothetical protein [Paenibacillus sp. SYP-B3998]NEW07183.1 hypothetical protein [Paenibacillus sp. SYP-B3998]